MYNTELWIIMEYVKGGSIYDKLKRDGAMPETHIAVVVREVLLGLQYLSSEGRIHRDIKGANILIQDTGEVKLADLGAAGQLTATSPQTGTIIGSPYWMAPEVMQGSYDGKADIWSLGITCIEMATADPPLKHLPSLQIIMHVVKNPPPTLEGDGFTDEFKEFIGLCLVKDPEQRSSIKQLLKHPFIQNAGDTSILAVSNQPSKDAVPAAESKEEELEEPKPKQAKTETKEKPKKLERKNTAQDSPTKPTAAVTTEQQEEEPPKPAKGNKCCIVM